MFNTNESTDISGVKFEIEKEGSDNVTPAISNDTPLPTVETPTGNGSGEPLPGKETPAPENKGAIDQAKASTQITPPAPADTPPTPSDNNDFVLEAEEFDSLVSEASNGRVNSIDELNEKLARLEELEKDPSVLFKDDHQKKIFGFLSKYQQDDYSQGIQTFAKLQQLDIEKLTPESALEELYILNNAKGGITKEEAKEMFKHEFAEKYDSKGDIGQTFLRRDGIMAKAELGKLKEEVNVPKVESQQEQQNVQARQDYLSQVETSFKNENGQFKELQISFSDNPEEDYTYQIPDLDKIQNAMSDYGSFFKERYVSEDGGYNMEQMKIDIAAVRNLPDILNKAFEHGVSIGEERKIRERNNVPIKNADPASNARQGGPPKDMQQAILEGMGKK